MVCIYCSEPTQVTNSRHQKRSNTVWRRRRCTRCAALFTTTESPDSGKALSVTSGSSSQAFLRDNLLLSVYESLKHRKTALADATALTDTILITIYATANDATIARDSIVDITSTVLKRFDAAAATSYSAFHPL